MLKKMGWMVLAMVFLSTLSAQAAMAKGAEEPGKSPMGRLYLFQKDPVTWKTLMDGAWGEIDYKLWGPKFDFVFNGHRLMPGEKYTLIYYPEPWPGEGLIVLGSVTADDFGDVRIEGKVHTGDLPAKGDQNNPLGAKIRLVPSEDVLCDRHGTKLTGWHPTESLFPYHLITFHQREDREDE